MFLKVLIFLYLLVALSYGGDSSESHISMCDKIEPIQHFDAKKIEGVWYIQEYDGYGENFLGDCLKFDITGVNGLVRFSDRIYREYLYINMTNIQEGNTSKYIFTFDPNVPLAYYWVDTDYDNFAIYYTGCKKKETVIILTRTRNQKAEIIKKAKEAMKKKGFNTDKMSAVKQNDCTN